MTETGLWTWSAAWSGSKVRVTIASGDAVQFVDECSAASAESRRRLLERVNDLLPGVDRQPIESRLLEMASAGPPKTDEALAVVPANAAPWDDPVDGAELLDEIVHVLRRYVVLPEHAAEACALWVLHSYVYERFQYSPRLLVTSPDKRCGKSLLLRFIGALSSRPLGCEGISAAALFRSLERFRPTLLLDEADTYLAGKNVNEDLRGTLNAGFAKGGCVLRCVGDDLEPQAFRVHGPLALGMIGRPPGTIEDRSIVVSMRRKTRTEQVDRLLPGRELRALLEPVLRRIVRWTQDHAERLGCGAPAMPAELDDRAADCWFALLAIADAAGGTWPNRSRNAAIALSAGRDGVDSLGLQLLTDLRSVFEEQPADRLSTDVLLRALVTMPERPWADYRRGRALTARQMSRLLEPFAVRPDQFRLGGVVVRGYARASLADPWARYLPGTPPIRDIRYIGLQPSNGADSRPIASVTPSGAVTDASVTPSAAVTDTSCPNGSSIHDLQQRNGCHGSEPPLAGEGMEELRELVDSMAAELVEVPLAVPFTGEDLRQHYRSLVRRDGLPAALADARSRYARHVVGEVPPLSRGIQ